MHVGDLCTQDFIIGTGPDMTIHAAAERMADEGVGCLIVIDSAGAIAGVITDRDIVVRVVAVGLDARDTPVSMAVSGPAVTINSTAGIEEACHRMREAGVRRLPVVDRFGKAVGLVSLDDLLRVPAMELLNLAEAAGASRRKSE